MSEKCAYGVVERHPSGGSWFKFNIALCVTPKSPSSSDAYVYLYFTGGAYYSNDYGRHWYETDPTVAMQSNWRMSLQRNYPPPGGGFIEIGSRTGYVGPSSPSPRTFTNIKSTDDTLMVAVEFTDDDVVSGYLESKYWKQ